MTEDEEPVLLDHGWRDLHFLAVCRAVDGQGQVALAIKGACQRVRMTETIHL